MAPGNVRNRLEAQGVVALDDRALSNIQAGLRFTPALCAVGVGAGTLLGSPALLLAMMTTAALGALLPRHPFDLIYNHGVRHVVQKPAIPRNAPPRRFSCGVAAVWLALTAGSFLLGWDLLGYGLGAALAAMASFVAATHICLPSIVYTRLFGRFGDVPEVSVVEAWRRLGAGACAVDLRDPAFWRAGHAPGALNLELSAETFAALPFTREQPLLVICQSGVSSLKGAKALRSAGFTAACSVSGGMSDWLKRGLPIESGGGA